MADYKKLTEHLERRGYLVRRFPSTAEAADYLDGQIDSRSVAFGGSMTLKAMNLYPRLSTHNQVVWHWEGGDLKDAAATDVYISSANALAETGEIINIDGVGNRVASLAFGHQVVYLVVGVNKITPDFESALWRARNVAAPKRAQSMGKQTPCAAKADRCYDCQSPDRICRTLSVLWGQPLNHPHMEIILIEQDLGM